jgi:hypothetical protein
MRGDVQNLASADRDDRLWTLRPCARDALNRIGWASSRKASTSTRIGWRASQIGSHAGKNASASSPNDRRATRIGPTLGKKASTARQKGARSSWIGWSASGFQQRS